MDKDDRRIFIQSQIACMYAELESMKAMNLERDSRGQSLAYDEDVFLALPEKYGLTHNQVIEFLVNP